jgi:hypothetical protein
MDTLEQQVGYLIAKMEEQGNDLKSMGSKLEALEKHVDEKFKTAEATFRVLRWVGSAAVAAFAVPWEKLIKFFG